MPFDIKTARPVKKKGKFDLSTAQLSGKQSALTPYASDNPGMVSRAWDALKIPEQKSREGLDMLAKMVPAPNPTGDLMFDMAANTPRIMAETVAETAPSFISRGSVVAGGLLKGAKLAAPAIRAVGKQVGRGAEKLSGLSYKTPGVLADTVKDPSLFTGRGTDAAREIYKGAQGSNRIREAFQGPLSKEKLVDEALNAVKDGSITAEEALEARKALDGIKKTLTDIGYRETRKIFDQIAKSKFAEADKAFQRAVKSEALRDIFPTNKSGTPSIVKMGVGGFAPYTAPFMSPMAQGATAATIGLGAKAITPFANNPLKSSVIPAAMNAIKNRKKRSSD